MVTCKHRFRAVCMFFFRAVTYWTRLEGVEIIDRESVDGLRNIKKNKGQGGHSHLMQKKNLLTGD